MKPIRRPQDVMDFRALESHATKRGATIEYGKGDHAQLVYGNSKMTYPRRKMGLGLAAKIFKWLVQMGLLCLVLIIILVILRLNGYTLLA